MLLGLVGCGGGSDESTTTTPVITLITTPTTEVVVLTVAPPETASSTEPDTAGTVPETTESPDVASTPPPVAAPTTNDIETRFTLTTGGVGTTSFGADPDGTIAFVSSFLGQPTGDTGWVDPFTIGPCGGTQLRQVNWGNLQLEFGDASTVLEGRTHFYAYTYGQEGSPTAAPAGLSTPEGITVGSSVGSLLAAYPNTQLLTADDFTPDSFVVNDNLRGRLSGLSDTDVVELIVGGLPCEG